MPATPTIETRAPEDCLRCGVCCFSMLDIFVRVSADDWARLGEEAERVAHFIGNRAFMRMHEGHCAGLELRKTADGRGALRVEYFCTVYERRPQICRDLGRGSPECLGELAMKERRFSYRRIGVRKLERAGRALENFK